MTYFVFSAPAAIIMMMRDGGVTAAVILIMAASVSCSLRDPGDENREYSGQRL